MNRLRKACLIGLLIILLLLALPFIWRGLVEWRYGGQMYTLQNAPQAGRVAIVFGARVYPSGRLSTMLRDRVDTAIQLYKSGQVDKILVSGDNRTADYNEPHHMMAYAIEQGIPPEDIQPDFAGRRTYDTCYRAKAVFQLEQVVLVTQDFHLPRALFICNNLGLEAIGVIADQQPYTRRSIIWSTGREIPATLVALYDVILKQPAPVLGEPIPLK